MVFLETLMIGVGLSADAFAVALGNGLCMTKARIRSALLVATFFGVFQGGMPVLGYAFGSLFADIVRAVDHYIALILLGFIGGRMVIGGVREILRERRAKQGGEGGAEGDVCSTDRKPLSVGTLAVQAVATSIDAFVVGVGLAAVGLSWGGLIVAAIQICLITFILSFAGVLLGCRFGKLLGSRAEIVGGLVLIGIGAKVFVEHMFLS
jgi:putative Mn2+ efflux pump MntP